MPAHALHLTRSDGPACDPITGLPSRAVLLDALGRMLQSARRTGGLVAALHVQLVGREPGNAVGGVAPMLRDSADLVRMLIRPCDVAARVSADDFVVALPEIRHESVAFGAAGRLHRALRNLHGSGGHVGIALYPADGLDAEALVRAARRATPTMEAIGYARAPAEAIAWRAPAGPVPAGVRLAG